MEYKFRISFEKFRKHFEKKFIDFFSSQCNCYDYGLIPQDSKNIAKDILNNIFEDGLVLSELSNDTFVQMRENRAMIGFLLNKSILYILEDYTCFLKSEEEHNIEYLAILIRSFSKFSHLFESDINNQMQKHCFQTGFGDENIIYSRNNILEIFSRMQKENKTIKFMNLYQGVPVSHEGIIVDIDGENVVFRITNELQEIAMKLEGKAYIIKNEYLPRHVKADISYSNFSNNTMVLNNFIFLLNMPAIQREFVRIYPKILVHVSLHGEDDAKLTGNLYDLSQKGLGLISESNIGFYNGAKVGITFEIDFLGHKSFVESEGEIVDIIEYVDSYRYCLKIFPNVENAQKIVNYISNREEEIIEDLKNELYNYMF